LPAGGVPLAVPVTVRGDSGFWQATLAWGTLPGGNDLDLVVRDGSGHELGRSDSFNGVGLFGQTEGTHLVGSIPEQLSLEGACKGGGSLLAQDFELRQETAYAVPLGFTDLGGLDTETLDRIARALSRHVMVGRGDRFDAAAPLTRGEAARALALGGGA